jgi:integrase
MSTSVPSTYPPARFIESLGDYLTVEELAEYLQLSKETIGAPNGTQDVHRALRSVRAWAGIDEELVPHALRKSAITAVSDALGLEAAAQFAGHKRSRVTEQYYAKRAIDAPDTSEVLGKLQGGPKEPAPVVEVDEERWGRREAGF